MIEFGGDYYPEQWPESLWPEDIRRMQEAHVTLVTVGVFAWSRIQPREGVFEFDWLDRVLDLLHDGRIGVDLATATASPPHWFTRKYPSSVPVTRAGVPLGPGSRQHFAPTSLAYRAHAAELVERVAERYAQHPAVQMWHVNNEFGCHVHADYSDNAAAAFRSWLHDRYGDIGSLNEAWGTAFWSQRYDSFEEVLPPRAAPYSVNPSGWLDFKRFTSDAFLQLFRMEKAIIRRAGATQPVTTNFMGAFEPINYWDWADDLDVVSDDSYPDPSDPESFRDAAFTRDLMRSIGNGRPWLLMEQAPNAVNWRAINAPKAPGQMAALSRQAVARGARGVLFFQWRQSRRGAEKFHSAMLPNAGTGTRTWHEVTKLGRTLASLPASAFERASGRVALIFDWESRWSLAAPDLPAAIDYLAETLRWYRALHRRNIMVDITPPGSDLAAYRLVVAPHLALLRDDAATKLLAWVERGGTLLTTPFTDVTDEHDAFLPGGFMTRLAPAVGAWVSEHEGLTEDTAVELAGGPATARVVADVLEVEGAEVIGRFSESWRAGRPMLTRNAFGLGCSIHLGALVDDRGTEFVLDLALSSADIRRPDAALPDGVELVIGTRGSLVINHMPQPVAVEHAGQRVTLSAFEVREVL